MKMCTYCKKDLCITKFYKRKGTLDGYRSECKKCSAKQSKRYYKRNDEKIKSAVSAWNKTEKGKESRAASTRKWVENNREKSKAHNSVAAAVRSGKLNRSSCEECGNSKSEAHHEDYTKPLKVDWLCSKCHKKRHME